MKMKISNPSNPLSTMAKAFLAWKGKLSVTRAYLAFLCSSLRLLIRQAGDVPIRSLTPAIIRRALAASPSVHTARHRFYAYKSFFQWAAGRHYLQRHPMSGLVPPVPPPTQRISPYTSGEVRQILCTLKNPLDVVAAALAAFAGLRTGELIQFNAAQDLGDDRILINRGKGRQLRSVPISPALNQWLAPLRASPGAPPRRLPAPSAVRRHGKLRGLPIEFHRLRLTFLAYRFAITGDLGLTAHEAGIVSPLYRNILHRDVAEAKRFWDLTPENCGRADWGEEVSE
jgi:integrase